MPLSRPTWPDRSAFQTRPKDSRLGFRAKSGLFCEIASHSSTRQHSLECVAVKIGGSSGEATSPFGTIRWRLRPRPSVASSKACA